MIYKNLEVKALSKKYWRRISDKKKLKNNKVINCKSIIKFRERKYEE